jgi:hypothetical protein
MTGGQHREALPLPHLLVLAVGAEVGREGDQLAHLLRVADGQLQPGVGPLAVPDDVRLLDAEVVHQGGDVVGERLEAEEAVDAGGVAVTLQLDGDDSVVLRQAGKHRAPQVDRAEGAVDEEQRGTVAVDLVVHLETVDWGVAALGRHARHRSSRAILRLSQEPARRD